MKKCACRYLAVLAIVILSIGCGGGGGGGAPPPGQSSQAPIVASGMAVDITPTSVTMHGAVIPNSMNTVAYFEYATNPQLSGAVKSPDQALGNSPASINVFCFLSGLTAQTTYYYRVVATNAAGTSHGNIVSFQTGAPSTPPTAQTLPAGLITTSSATLNASVNPNGLATSVYFEWGTNAQLTGSTTTTAQSIGSGTVSVNVSFALPGLTASTTCYYRVIAVSSAGTSGGTILEFTTLGPSLPPAVQTLNAGSITQTTATLNAIVNPNGFATTTYFLWGTDPQLSGAAKTPDQTIGSGTTNVSTNASLTGLASATTYFFKVVATNGPGTSEGAIVSFTTVAPGSPPTADTLSATNVTDNSVTFTGSANPNSLAATAWFEWGMSPTLSTFSATSAKNIGSGTASVPVTASQSGLTAATTYYYRIAVQNSAGISRGNILSFTTLSLPPSATWIKTYGANYGMNGYSSIYSSEAVQQTTDGGYVVAGYVQPIGTVGLDMYLVRVDDSGIVQWEKNYGGVNSQFGTSVQQTTDDGFILAGSTANDDGSQDNVFLVKTDSNGNTVWTRTFGGKHGLIGSSVRQTSDGGYIIAAHLRNYVVMDFDIYLIKTDSNGNKVWERTYGGTSEDGRFAACVQQTSDGGYIIASDTSSFGAGNYDVYLIKTDSSGNVLWTRTFGGANPDGGYYVQQTSDGGYAVAGYTTSFGAGNYDVYLIKTDSSGNLTWQKTFGGTGTEWGLISFQQTTDGGYIVAGNSRALGTGNYDAYLIKTDSSGILSWQKTFGGTGSEERSASIKQTSDGGYIIAGDSASFNPGFTNIYLVKTDANGNVGNSAVLQPGPEGLDVWLSSFKSYDDYGVNDNNLKVGGWGDYYYSLIQFNLDGLPAQATSARIYLYALPYADYVTTSMYLDRVTGPWDEDTGFYTKPTTESLREIPEPAQLYAWYSIDVTDLYNQWKAGTYPNYGIQLRPTNNTHTLNFFYSSDYSSDPTLRPKLVVEW